MRKKTIMQTNTVSTWFAAHYERGFVGELGAWDVPMKERIHLTVRLVLNS
jgi:hypothetical protein